MTADGCTNAQELGLDETLGGGLRDPLNPWDFHDVLAPVATPQPTDALSPTATPSPVATATPVPEASPPGSAPGLFGDVGCDGTISVIDAMLILQHSAALLSSLACQDAGDVNGDGRVDPLDATLILQYVAGLIDSL